MEIGSSFGGPRHSSNRMDVRASERDRLYQGHFEKNLKKNFLLTLLYGSILLKTYEK